MHMSGNFSFAIVRVKEQIVIHYSSPWLFFIISSYLLIFQTSIFRASRFIASQLILFTIQALNPGFFLLSCGLIALLHKSNKYLPPFSLPSSSFNLCSSVSICVQKSISTCPLFLFLISSFFSDYEFSKYTIKFSLSSIKSRSLF